MSENESAPTHRPDLPPTDGAVPPPGRVNARRRRFLTQGLVGGPVALYVAGRPVKSLAWHDACTYSAYSSINAAGGTSLTHTGCTPGGYAWSCYNPGTNGQPKVPWPSQYSIGSFSSKTGKYTGGTSFNSVFTLPSGNDSNCFSTILYLGNVPGEATFIAALFNALKGLTGVSTTYLIQTLWPEYVGGTANLQTQILGWLDYLQPHT